MKKVEILAIETSCDETAAAVIEDGKIVLSNIISSQVDLHQKYGGVVPEIAARAHIENIISVIASALYKAKREWAKIDAIAVTRGPGLLGSLLIGVNTARSLSYLKKRPLIAINHLEGHIYANFVSMIQDNKPKVLRSKMPTFPLLALIVSGGHTNIVYMREHLKYKIIGQTIDDAAGEAFDKAAKLLGLGYPGGPIISRFAEEGDPTAYNFPRTDLTPPPKRNDRGYLVKPKPSLNFSFSGLKTAILTEVKKCQSSVNCQLPIANLSASFQQAVIDVLIRNVARAINLYKPKTILLSGGVAANKELHYQLQKTIVDNYQGIDFFVPPLELCTDNAAMIGIAAYYKYINNRFADWRKLTPDPNLKLR